MFTAAAVAVFAFATPVETVAVASAKGIWDRGRCRHRRARRQREYNEERPKKGLGGLTPAAYARHKPRRAHGEFHWNTTRITASFGARDFQGAPVFL